MESITIHDGISVIGSYAFYSCKNLKTVTIGDNLQYIGGDAFYKCVVLTTVTISSVIKHIGKNAFKICTSLVSFNISEHKLKEEDGFYIDDRYYHSGYDNGAFSGYSSLSLKERKK